MTLTRGFSGREKFLLLFFVLIVVGAAYYYLVDQPIRTRMETAQTRQEELNTELMISTAKVEKLKKMQAELEAAKASGKMASTYMPSYNNVKEEIRFLNDILDATKEYNLSIANVTRSGDQIRRGVALVFRTATYGDARGIIESICESANRVLVTNVHMESQMKDITIPPGMVIVEDRNGNPVERPMDNDITVTMNLVFYETMVEGTEDTGLPVSK